MKVKKKNVQLNTIVFCVCSEAQKTCIHFVKFFIYLNFAFFLFVAAIKFLVFLFVCYFYEWFFLAKEIFFFLKKSRILAIMLLTVFVCEIFLYIYLMIFRFFYFPIHWQKQKFIYVRSMLIFDNLIFFLFS